MCTQGVGAAGGCECSEPRPVSQRRTARDDGEQREARTFYCPEPLPAAAAPSPDTTPVAEVVPPGFTCLDPELEAGKAAEILEHEGACCAPVVDDRGALVGVVSAEALLRLREQVARDRREDPGALGFEVEDAMAAPEHTLPPTASIAEVAARMLQWEVERVPLVTPGGEVVGVVTAADLLRWLASGQGVRARAAPPTAAARPA